MAHVGEEAPLGPRLAWFASINWFVRSRTRSAIRAHAIGGGPAQRALVGDLYIAPRGTSVIAVGVLSSTGDFSVTLPAAALGFGPYAQFTLQAFAFSGNRVRLSNALVRLLRP